MRFQDGLHGTTASRRTVTLQSRERHEALVAWRAWTQTDEFRTLYARRAGVEGTMSVGVRAFGMRRSRYFGFGKDAVTAPGDCVSHQSSASRRLAYGKTEGGNSTRAV